MPGESRSPFRAFNAGVQCYNYSFTTVQKQRAEKMTLNSMSCKIRDKVFKNGPSKTCGRQPLINLKCLSRPYPFKFF